MPFRPIARGVRPRLGRTRSHRTRTRIRRCRASARCSRTRRGASIGTRTSRPVPWSAPWLSASTSRRTASRWAPAPSGCCNRPCRRGRSRRRGGVRVALVRGLSDRHPIVGGTCVQVPLADEPTTSTPWRPPSRPHPGCVRVQPQQPDRTSVRRDLERFSSGPVRPLVIFDEAYREFVRDARLPDGLGWRDRPNVAVLRTFSKAYGLAGLRVGFAVAHPRSARRCARPRVPFGVSALAEDAAVASLGRSRSSSSGSTPSSRSASACSAPCAARVGRCRTRRPTSSGCVRLPTTGRRDGMRGRRGRRTSLRR